MNGTLEREIFGCCTADEKKLREYGFREDGHTLVYTLTLPEEKLRIVLTCDRAFSGRIEDLSFGGEYTNFRLASPSGYGTLIRKRYEELLRDVRDRCCEKRVFRSEQAERINARIRETYDVMPEFLWPNVPSYAAFRRKQGGRWFAVIGSVPRRGVDPLSASEREAEVINVKAGRAGIDALLARTGVYPAFHMNKKCWVSVILDDTLPDGEILGMIAESYESL